MLEMRAHLTTLPLFIVHVLCAVVAVAAEDGSQAWLRYKLAPPDVLLGYRNDFAARLVQVGASKSVLDDAAGLAQLQAAAHELSDGLTQILGYNVTYACCRTPDEEPASGTLHVEVMEAATSLGKEGFEIGRTGSGDVLIRAGTASGALYGSFHLLSFMQRAEPVPGSASALQSIPALGLRIWDMWDNLDGSIERGFGGRSLIWPMALRPDEWTQAVALRVEGMARLLKSVGLNGVTRSVLTVSFSAPPFTSILLPLFSRYRSERVWVACRGTGVVLNNVNACGGNTALLKPNSIASIGQNLEPIFKKWGLRLYLSPCYAAPLSSGMGLPVRIAAGNCLTLEMRSASIVNVPGHV